MKTMVNRYLLFILLIGSNMTVVQSSEMTLQAYAKQCETIIAKIPKMDARDARQIPITVNGKTPLSYNDGMKCDKPSLLPSSNTCSGGCTPYSRVKRLRDDKKAQMVVYYRQNVIREANTYLYDEIDVIIHSVVNGETCWFQAVADNPNCDPNIGLDGTNIPLPSEKNADKFWKKPQQVADKQCSTCHDNDPFYYSPYIAQVNEIPANPLGKYANSIGPFAHWPPLESIHSRGNTCTGCHRIGNRSTCSVGLLQSIGKAPSPYSLNPQKYPFSHWMPINNPRTQSQWDAIYQLSIKTITECCHNPDSFKCIRQPIK